MITLNLRPMVTKILCVNCNDDVVRTTSGNSLGDGCRQLICVGCDGTNFKAYLAADEKVTAFKETMDNIKKKNYTNFDEIIGELGKNFADIIK